MTTRRDPDRLIRAFLDEGLTDLPDRTYDAVRSAIERKRQRVVFGPWRPNFMNTYLKAAIAAAAIVVVAVVGINLLPAGSSPVGGSPTPSPKPSPTPDRTPGPRPTEAAPPEGAIAPGTYTALADGVTVSFTIAATDWQSFGGGAVGTSEYGGPDSISIRVGGSAPEGTYSDPCAHTPLDPAPNHTAADLIAAVAAMPGIDVVSGPSTVTVGGQTAQTVAFTIRDDINCDPQEFYLWYDDSSGGPEGGWIWAGALGSTHQAWAVDVDDVVVWIDSESFAGQGPEVATTIQQVIDSIQFN